MCDKWMNIFLDESTDLLEMNNINQIWINK